MKQKIIIVNLACCLLLVACGKKRPNSSLAKNYFQQSLIAAEKNKREALVLIEQSIKTEPTPRAYALKATLLYQIGEYQESLKLFENIVNDKSTPIYLKTDVSNNFACNLLALGQIDKAEAVWQNLAEDRHYLSPEVAWFNLGLLELARVPEKQTTLTKKEKSHLEKAETYFRKANKINQDYIDSYYYLTLALIRLNRLDEAKQEVVQIIGIMPEHKNAKNLLTTIDKLKRQNRR